jgi:site-specific DNA-methyltransferase (adenine-specific)
MLVLVDDRPVPTGPPVSEPPKPVGSAGPGPPPADRGWRAQIARWPIPWRERWGYRANELQDRGEPRDAAEWIAYGELAPEVADAERRGEVVCTDPAPALSDAESVAAINRAFGDPAPARRDEGSASPDGANAGADRTPGIRDPAAGYQVIPGDARRVLPTLAGESMHCCVTSPPYFRHRDYGVAGQIGQERTPDEYVANLVEVFREVKRILRPDGTLFLVLGDTYDDRGNLLGIPHRTAEALKQDGWCWRSSIIWAKAWMAGDVLEGSCMPGSQEDRCTPSYETVLQLARDRRYYFDGYGTRAASGAMLRNVWRINTEPSRLGHFALMPRELAERCIRLGTSERGCCPKCLAPWRRLVEKERVPTRPGRGSKVYVDPVGSPYARHNGSVIRNRDPRRHTTVVTPVGWEPGCRCGIDATVPCRVVDPFGGLATTAVAAVALGRACITIELNPEYCAEARRRLAGDDPSHPHP